MAVHVPGVWGIDLGQCALKAIRMEVKDGQVIATAFDHIEHPKILSQPDADPDQLTREALEQFLSRNSLRGDMVVISVPGQSGLARFVKLPPVEEKKIADIVRFEAKQQIPFPLEEVVWDFQKLSSGSLTGDFVETEIGLFAMKREMVNRALQQFKEVNVEVHVIQMAPLALCNFIAYDQLAKGTPGIEDAEEEPGAKKQCVVALDMGTDSSNLVITDGARIIWQRPLPIGGNHFTRALTKDLKLTFAKAEHLKRNAAKSPDLRKILASLKSVLNDFVGEVQRSLGYFTNTHRDAQIKYMVGLGNAFRLPGLKQFLQEKLQLEVRKLGKFERLSGDAVTVAPTFAENIMGFGVAYGLALQGLKQARLHTNLLPHEVRVERLVRGKKPWAAAAAACLLVAVAGLAMAKGLENSHVTGSGIAVSLKAAKDAKALADANNAAIDAEDKKIEQSKQNLERLGAGTKERLNWQLLQEYINYALPLPNGERLAERARDGFPVRDKFLNKDAIIAFTKLEARRFPKLDEAIDKKKAAQDDQFIKKHLIQVNIAGVMPLYSDDLQPYFRKIHKEGDALFGMDAGERNAVLDFVNAKDQESRDKVAGIPKSGWVVEVRGYTYHKGEMDFVMKTLLENLRQADYTRRRPGWKPGSPPDWKVFMEWLDKQPDEAKKKILSTAELTRELSPPEPVAVAKIDKGAKGDKKADKIDNAGKPEQVENAEKPVEVPAQFKHLMPALAMEELIHKRIGYLFVYKNKSVPNPEAGKFELIGRSELRELVKGIADGGGGKEKDKGMMQPPGAPGGDQAKGGDAPKANRDAWNPIGEIATAVLGGGGGGNNAFGGGHKEAPPPALGGNLQARTEFVILFVWREPLPVQAAPPAPDGK
jgi:type IV pilus assembly protein PilM